MVSDNSSLSDYVCRYEFNSYPYLTLFSFERLSFAQRVRCAAVIRAHPSANILLRFFRGWAMV